MCRIRACDPWLTLLEDILEISYFISDASYVKEDVGLKYQQIYNIHTHPPLSLP